MSEPSHAYPSELAAVVRERWPNHGAPLPDLDPLAGLLSTCYQASLLREEERPITFRLLLGDPGDLPSDQGPPGGVHVLPFSAMRSLDPDELRRLSPAASFHRAMLGAVPGPAEIRLWGVVHTGPSWSRPAAGGRPRDSQLPPWLVIQVRAPGELSVHCGDQAIATLRGGTIEQEGLDVFQSQWLPAHFAQVRDAVMDLHRAARAASTQPWADLDADVIRMLAQHVVRRTISVMRQRRHGGTVLYLPNDYQAIFDEHLSLKYTFDDHEGRRRFRRVMVQTINALASSSRSGTSVGWRAYGASRDPQLTELDEAIFELGHLFADLSSVDGALVLTQGFEVLGFGAEISGLLPVIRTVWCAQDPEGQRTEPRSPELFGTRHRSVFRLCDAHPSVVAIVISQDGQVRFVKRFGEQVVYFDHRVMGAM